MIVKDQPSSFQLFLEMQGSIVPKISPKVLLISALSFVVFLIDLLVTPLPRISITAMGIFGVALSLFLGFRNNAAYDRWWEGRVLWGKMIADMRSLGRNAQIFMVDSDAKGRLISTVMASIHLHRGFLRKLDARPEAEPWIGPDLSENLCQHQNPANAALQHAAQQIGDLARAEQISGFGQIELSRSLAALTLSQAGCERIASTPLPFVYSLLVRRTTYIYCWLLPFALLDATGGFAPVLAAAVAYVFFGLQAVTNELEMPFQNIENGLPLDAMCRTVEISMAEALGRVPPAPMQPINQVIT
ncbi:putative membrane protein [Aliiroseovarius halocynthiae]|uniref:Bestrophin n=1 Tax=Aliiroseovarius halocynthiae TaxID=985055 RepID=A0A545SWX8_9RHOB|nr:bestrophin family ion channel [Aliiroseovarius halocynthiae]TQV69460.1 hypothetical protein FIL88_07910 [Aliiroseovarius halocynthiae]SMR72856.1 putative membrane protein [Aliiroseovarius halocynthiae]